MKKIKNKVARFLKRYEMDYLDVDIEGSVEAFLQEMDKGLAGRKSSLEMIPTHIEAGAGVPVNKRVIVADAGGTNFRAATVYFDENKKAIIENLSLYRMPGAERKVSKDEFFRIMAGYLKDVAGQADNIGFCFSYPMEITPDKDGRLLRFSKEIKAGDVVGTLIGENLNAAMATMGAGNKHIVLLNDTVATLLAGCGYKNRVFSSYVGFILGTGTNCCYVERNSNIRKQKNLDLSKSQLVNSESGGFGKIRQGKIDTAFDKSTVNPGEHKFEKMISGAYLGPVCLLTIKKGCREGLFTKQTCKALNELAQLGTKDINEFMQYPYGAYVLANICRQGGADDAIALYYIADRLTERAAKLTAINLSSIALKCGQGKDPTRPICIVAEGTTFYQMKTLKDRVGFYLKQYLENKHGIYTEIISVENATLIGAAIAGLTN